MHMRIKFMNDASQFKGENGPTFDIDFMFSEFE